MRSNFSLCFLAPFSRSNNSGSVKPLSSTIHNSQTTNQMAKLCEPRIRRLYVTATDCPVGGGIPWRKRNLQAPTRGVSGAKCRMGQAVIFRLLNVKLGAEISAQASASVSAHAHHNLAARVFSTFRQDRRALRHFLVWLKYFRSGGGWSFLTGIKAPSAPMK